MELNVLTSQKGTKVVTATNLHLVLGLNNTQYNSNVKRWLNDVYEFSDGIRKPIPLRDFAKRKVKDNTIFCDYYISLEFAKQITLRTNSKSKMKYALQLQALDGKSRQDGLVTNEEITEALELAMLLSVSTYQDVCEQEHFKKYEARNGGSSANWWRHRSQVLGYSSDSLKKKAERMGKQVNGKSQKQILQQIDKYEMIRTATIDLLIARDKSDKYARKMGDLAKSLAQQLNLGMNKELSTVEDLKLNSTVVNWLKSSPFLTQRQQQLQRA